MYMGPPIAGNYPLDESIIEKLLEEVEQIHSCDSYGSSLWSEPAKISTTLANGEPKLYFLKVLVDYNILVHY